MYSGLLSYYDWDGLRVVLVLDTHDVCASIYRLHVDEAHRASLLNRVCTNHAPRHVNKFDLHRTMVRSSDLNNKNVVCWIRIYDGSSR